MALDFPSTSGWLPTRTPSTRTPSTRRPARTGRTASSRMVVKAEPTLGIPEDLAMSLDVHQGECRGCTLLPASEAEADGAVRRRRELRAVEAGHQEGDRPHQGAHAGKAEADQGPHAHDGQARECVEAARRVDDARSDEVPRRVSRYRPPSTPRGRTPVSWHGRTSHGASPVRTRRRCLTRTAACFDSTACRLPLRSCSSPTTSRRCSSSSHGTSAR